MNKLEELSVFERKVYDFLKESYETKDGKILMNCLTLDRLGCNFKEYDLNLCYRAVSYLFSKGYIGFLNQSPLFEERTSIVGDSAFLINF